MDLTNKIKLLLEEKSMLEDEIVSIAALARQYQSQARFCKEELEKLESSYHSICAQNSALESELIRLNSQVEEKETENTDLKNKINELDQKMKEMTDKGSFHQQTVQGLVNKNKVLEVNNEELQKLIKHLTEEFDELKETCKEKNEEIQSLKGIVDKEKVNTAIKELSYIILSKDRSSPESPIKNTNYNQLFTDMLENKIKSVEQECQEYLTKYRNILFKYIESLKECKEKSVVILNKLQDEKKSLIKEKMSYLDIEIELSEFELENLECREMSYYTSFGESLGQEEVTKQKPFPSIHFLLIQASAIENLLSSSMKI